MIQKLANTEKHSSEDVLRFAHPFFTETPIADRKTVQGIGNRMTDHIKTQLEQIPDPIRNTAMTLADVVGNKGANEIEQAGYIVVQAVGDTGTNDALMQQMVAKAMKSDFNLSDIKKCPAFFLHLGDVNYYENNDKGYQEQFYSPYRDYPGKIIAIPGNHDGELFKYDGTPSGQTKTLQAFMDNFCQKVTGVPPAAKTTYREMISQPGVYWWLQTPFADIVGLYSNIAENPGYISAPSIGTKQKTWLDETLKTIAKQRATSKKKALIIATHHPPLSGGHHSGSTEMLDDIDDSCQKASIMPTAFFAAHAHNLQAFTRYVKFQGADLKIPFIVAGGGGRRVQSVNAADQQIVNCATKLQSKQSFDYSIQDYGYSKITANLQAVTIELFTVDKFGKASQFTKVVTPI